MTSHEDMRKPPMEQIQDIGQLLARARQMKAEGRSQRQILEWLSGLTATLGIRLRHDEHLTELMQETKDSSGAAEGHASEAPPGDALPDFVAGPAADSTAADPASAKVKKKNRPIHLPVTVHRGRLYIGGLPPKIESAHTYEEHGDSSGYETQSCDGSRFAFLDDGRLAVGRVILSCDRRKAHGEVPLCAQANGVVIDAQRWSLLTVPPRAFNPRKPVQVINRHLAQERYEIIRVDDGTVVTLYSWVHPDPQVGRIWCLSTSNGYDVSALRWMGQYAYAEIIYKLATEIYGGIPGLHLRRKALGENDVRLHFDEGALDCSRCYTIGFRFTDFHPLALDPCRMWQIQWADLADGVSRFGDGGLPNVPYQTVCNYADLRGSGRVVTVDILRERFRDSLTRAKSAIAHAAGKQPQKKAHSPVPELHYGYILRSTSLADTGMYSDILLESPLLLRVRNLVYQRPRNNHEVDHESRLEHSMLRAFLSIADKTDFLKLFPQFGDKFRSYKDFIDNVVSLVIQMQRQKFLTPERGCSTRTPTAKVAHAMLMHINRHEQLNAFHKDATQTVRAYVIRQEYCALYLQALGKMAAE